MAAMVGASTGAFVTASVMLHELTDDNNIVLPVITTTVLAFGVRKLVSPGSIYTIKLIRRGHVVPEGLQAALDDARNVAHVMSKNYRVDDGKGGANEPVSGVTIEVQNGEIRRVLTPYSDTTNGHFLLLAPDEPLITAIQKMNEGQSAVALVSSKPDSHQIENVVGVVTYRELSLYREDLAPLFD